MTGIFQWMNVGKNVPLGRLMTHWKWFSNPLFCSGQPLRNRFLYNTVWVPKNYCSGTRIVKQVFLKYWYLVWQKLKQTSTKTMVIINTILIFLFLLSWVYPHETKNWSWRSSNFFQGVQSDVSHIHKFVRDFTERSIDRKKKLNMVDLEI